MHYVSRKKIRNHLSVPHTPWADQKCDFIEDWISEPINFFFTGSYITQKQMNH